MGFGRKTPPPPNENVASVSPKHQRTWYDRDGSKHNNVCYCDTGKNHTTPKDS